MDQLEDRHAFDAGGGQGVVQAQESDIHRGMAFLEIDDLAGHGFIVNAMGRTGWANEESPTQDPVKFWNGMVGGESRQEYSCKLLIYKGKILIAGNLARRSKILDKHTLIFHDSFVLI